MLSLVPLVHETLSAPFCQWLFNLTDVTSTKPVACGAEIRGGSGAVHVPSTSDTSNGTLQHVECLAQQGFHVLHSTIARAVCRWHIVTNCLLMLREETFTTLVVCHAEV